LENLQIISFLPPKAYQDAFNELLAVLMGNSQLTQQVPTTDTIVTFPSRQLSEPPNAAASFPPPLPKTRRNSAIASHRQSFHISRTVLLIGLVLLVIASGVGIFAVNHANQLAILNG